MIWGVIIFLFIIVLLLNPEETLLCVATVSALVIVLVIVIIAIFYTISKTHKKKEIEAQKANRKFTSNEIKKYFFNENYLVLLDTNIWMNFADDPNHFYSFFLNLIYQNPYHNIFVLNSQINELEHLKSSPLEKKKYAACTALKIIKDSQKQKVSHVLSEDAFNEISFSCVDRNILQITKYLITRKINLLIVTDDAALTIKLRAIIEQNAAQNIITVIDSKDLGAELPYGF